MKAPLRAWDDQEAYFRHLVGFFEGVQAGRFAAGCAAAISSASAL